MIVSTKAAPALIGDILRAGLVPMLHGSPGTAKSSISKQIAAAKKLMVIDLRLSQSDPTDLSGFPSINNTRTRAGYVPMDTFPIKGDTVPEGYNGWLILLDEINSAPLSVQAAAYKLVLDRQVGQFDLHEQVYMIAAGNLSTDNAIVNRLSTAMQSRLVHLHIELDPKDWMHWANTNGLDYRVISYIGFKPDILHKFDPNHNDFTFPCSRTWEFVSKIIKPWKEIPYDKGPVLDGAVGEGAAREFIGYCEIFQSLPTISEIINNPEKVDISDEPSIQYALTGLISNNINSTNFDSLMKCIVRLPIEFQVVCLQASFRRAPEIGTNPAWKAWSIKNAQALL